MYGCGRAFVLMVFSGPLSKCRVISAGRNKPESWKETCFPVGMGPPEPVVSTPGIKSTTRIAWWVPPRTESTISTRARLHPSMNQARKLLARLSKCRARAQTHVAFRKLLALGGPASAGKHHKYTCTPTSFHDSGQGVAGSPEQIHGLICMAAGVHSYLWCFPDA